MSVSRILFYHFHSLLVGKLAEPYDGSPLRIKIGLFFQLETRILQYAGHHFGNGRSRREARGLYAGSVDESRRPLRFADDEVVAVRHGTHARKRGYHIPEVERPGGPERTLYGLANALRRGLPEFLVVYVLRGGPQHQVAVHRRGDQYPLAHLGGHLEDDRMGDVPLHLIQYEIFSLAGSYLKGLAPGHIVYLVGIQARRVYHIFRLEFAVRRVYGKIPAVPVYAGDGTVKEELRPVHSGVFGQAHGKREGAYYPRRPCEKRPHGLAAYIGFQFPESIPVQYLHTGNSVFHPPVIEIARLPHFLIGEGDHQRAVALERHVKVFADLVVHLVAADI